MKRLTKRCNGVVTYIGASNEYELSLIHISEPTRH